MIDEGLLNFSVDRLLPQKPESIKQYLAWSTEQRKQEIQDRAIGLTNDFAVESGNNMVTIDFDAFATSVEEKITRILSEKK